MLLKVNADRFSRPAILEAILGRLPDMTAPTKLTDAKLTALKPNAAVPYEVGDTHTPRLRINVLTTGTLVWRFRFRISGQAPRNMNLGRYPAVSIKAAREAAAALRSEVSQGRDPAAAKVAAAAPGNTVAAAFELYDAAHLSTIGPATAAATRSFFARRVLPAWGPRAVGSVTRQDVVALLDTLAGFADARRKGKTRLSHFFGWVMDRNATVASNPAAGIQTTIPAARERVLSDAELRAVWLACDDRGTFGAMVRTLILTAARRGEVAEMTRAELTDSAWTIPAARTKNGRAMTVHRTAALNAVLPHGDGAFVFEGRHNGRPLGGFSDLKAKLDAALGDTVPPWTLHDLRRTSASLLQKLGVAFEVREAMLNHTIKGVAGVYGRHDYSAEKAAGFEALAAEVARIVAGGAANVVSLRA
jgi:integrase